MYIFFFPLSLMPSMLYCHFVTAYIRAVGSDYTLTRLQEALHEVVLFLTLRHFPIFFYLRLQDQRMNQANEQSHSQQRVHQASGDSFGTSVSRRLPTTMIRLSRFYCSAPTWLASISRCTYLSTDSLDIEKETKQKRRHSEFWMVYPNECISQHILRWMKIVKNWYLS